MFLDANIFIYAFEGTDGRRSKACKQFLNKVSSGEQHATTSPLVAEEVTHFFLEKRGKAFALRVLRNISENPHIAKLSVDERALTLVHEFINAGLGSADALHAATMKVNGESIICSFDSGFDRAPGIRRKEP
ncbi:MAG: type II toxin-antitoxin system VapC family toxin [Candidatus Micrarchaeota archaeon]|nr:type II toxin-antitoxin system VapC family toxin [Candidatus Micrarchaeota archaeon]